MKLFLKKYIQVRNYTILRFLKKNVIYIIGVDTIFGVFFILNLEMEK